MTETTQQPPTLGSNDPWLLKEENALALLEELSGRDFADLPQTEQTSARELTRFLECFSPALGIAGGYLEQKKEITFTDFKTLIPENLGKDLKNQLFPGDKYDNLSAQEKKLLAVLVSVQSLVSQNPLLQEILEILTWSNSSPMRVSLVAASLGKDESETGFIEALKLGTDLRLLFKTGEEGDEERYEMQLPLRRVLQEAVTLTGRDEWVIKISEYLGDWFEARRKESGDDPEFNQESIHLDQWATHVEKLSPYHFGRLTWLRAYPPFHRRELETAKHMVEEALALLEKSDRDSRETRVHILTDLGYIYSDLTDFPTAIIYHEKALALQVELYGDNHPETAETLCYVANTYEGAGDLDKALEYLKRALQIRIEHFGEEHLETADSLNNLGNTFYQAGRYSEAIGYLENALLQRTRFLGEAAKETTLTLYNLAICFIHIKRFKDAYDWVSKYVKKIPTDHPQYRELSGLLPYIDSECVKSGFRPPSGVRSGGHSKKKNKKKKKK